MSPPASGTAARMGWVLHGLRVEVGSASEEAAAYLRAHLGSAAATAPDRPDLRVDLGWRWGGGDPALQSGESPGSPAGRGGARVERVGRHLEEIDGLLRWGRVPGFEGLTLEARSSGLTTEVAARCGYSPRDPFARIRYLNAGRREKKTNRTLFKLLYYGLYFPIAWRMEATRGWELLHASAVEKEGRGLVLAGHGGSGKSTLALSLMADRRFRFISDNLVFHDGRSIHALPEPVRLDGSSLAAIRAAGFDPPPSGLPRTAHPKATFQVDPSRCAGSAEAAAVVLLRFTGESFLRPLAPAETAAHLVGARDLVREVEGFRAVAAFLAMATAGGAGDRGEAITPASTTALASHARGYLMGIGRGEPVRKTLDRLAEIFP